MEEHHEHQVPIWLFVGAILLIYGVLIAASGTYGWLFPPAENDRVKLWDLHADIWWGLVMAAVGAIYCVRFNPFKDSGGTP